MLLKLAILCLTEYEIINKIVIRIYIFFSLSNVILKICRGCKSDTENVTLDTHL